MIVRKNKDQEFSKVTYQTRESGGGFTKQRTCLKCGKLFESIGRGNRICPVCSLANTQHTIRSVRIHSSS